MAQGAGPNGLAPEGQEENMFLYCAWHKSYWGKTKFIGIKKPYLLFRRTDGICAKCQVILNKEIDNFKAKAEIIISQTPHGIGNWFYEHYKAEAERKEEEKNQIIY